MRVGSLCSGIGGLELGLAIAGLEIETVWRSDNSKEINKWGAERFPDVPNLGDLTEIDELPPVELITAGFPCQPVSQAGEKKGVEDDRWLFDDIVRLVGRMETPPYLFIENVPGLLATRDPEPFRRVLFGLASIGFVGRYGIVAASQVGSPHLRRRWFCVARHRDAPDTNTLRRGGRRGRDAETGGRTESANRGRTDGDADTIGGEGRDAAGLAREAGSEVGCQAVADAHAPGLQGPEHQRRRNVPTRCSDLAAYADSVESERRGGSGFVGGSATTESREEDQRERTGDASGHSRSSVSDSDEDGREERGLSAGTGRYDIQDPERGYWFGPHWSAVERWEAVLGRRSPAGALDENGRLSAEFVEFMMGYDEGWVTSILNRRPSLRALGNSVVPQQAAAAWTLFSEKV